jgi:hypothetical protein
MKVTIRPARLVGDGGLPGWKPGLPEWGGPEWGAGEVGEVAGEGAAHEAGDEPEGGTGDAGQGAVAAELGPAREVGDPGGDLPGRARDKACLCEGDGLHSAGL